MSIPIIVTLLVLHFIADFVLQSDAIAKSKSKSNKALLTHIVIYGSVFLVIGPMFAIVTAVLHGMVDYVTSRWSSYLWGKGDTHDFFVVIGFDQLLHMLMLITVYRLVGG